MPSHYTDLSSKLNFLFTDPAARAFAESRSDLPSINSLETLAHALGLKSHTSLVEGAGISEPTEAKLLGLFEIPVDSPCHVAFREKPRKEFAVEFHKIHPPGKGKGRRRLGLPLEVDRARSIKSETSPLAALTLFPGQGGPGKPWPISFELCCNPDEDDFDNVAITRGRLIVQVGDADISRTSRPGFAEALVLEGSEGPVSFIWNGPRGDGYVWRVSAEGAYIGNVGLPGEEVFCEIENLAPGDKLIAQFEIVLKDLTHKRETAPKTNDSQLPLVQLGVEDLGEAKEWVIRRLKELALSQDGARVLLAEHVIPFKERNLQPDEVDEA